VSRRYSPGCTFRRVNKQTEDVSRCCITNGFRCLATKWKEKEQRPGHKLDEGFHINNFVFAFTWANKIFRVEPPHRMYKPQRSSLGMSNTAHCPAWVKLMVAQLVKKFPSFYGS